MTGRASAELICKHSVWNHQLSYQGYCGNVVRPDLYIDNDGHIRFDVPQGWYVDLRTEVDVMCPQHNPLKLPHSRMPIGGHVTPWHDLMPLRSAILHARRAHLNIELDLPEIGEM